MLAKSSLACMPQSLAPPCTLDACVPFESIAQMFWKKVELQVKSFGKKKEKAWNNIIVRNVRILQLADILVVEYWILPCNTVNAKWTFRDLQRTCQTADLEGGIGARNFPQHLIFLKHERQEIKRVRRMVVFASKKMIYVVPKRRYVQAASFESSIKWKPSRKPYLQYALLRGS